MIVIRCNDNKIFIDNSEYMTIMHELDLFKEIKSHNNQIPVLLKVDLECKLRFLNKHKNEYRKFESIDYPANSIISTRICLEKIISFLNKCDKNEKVIIYEVM